MNPDSRSPSHPGVLLCVAVELRSAPDVIEALDPIEAGDLAARIASDLHKLDPDAAQLEMLTVGALYDPVELLRPMWPIHIELRNLAARAPRKPSVAKGDEVLAGQGRLIAFGASNGVLPGNLATDPQFAGGPMRLMPVVLQGEPAIAAGVIDSFERQLLEEGMASAETALWIQQKFSVDVEHARYMTAFDLAAMMQLQYRHAGVGFLWPIIESALLGRNDRIVVDESPEPAIIFENGEAHLPLVDPDQWLAQHGEQFGVKTEAAGRSLWAQFEMRRAQLAALLQAHRIPTVIEGL